MLMTDFMTMDWLALIFALLGLVVLGILSAIDLRTWLLPNKFVATFALLGVAFHACLHFQLIPVHQMLFGLLAGGGILYVIRMGGNAYYKQDTLGLGDVKLLAAAGLWLGVEGVVIALTAGAFAGLLHGIAVGLIQALREKRKANFSRLMIPAGPGFCVGIIGAWLWLFYDYFKDAL